MSNAILAGAAVYALCDKRVEQLSILVDWIDVAIVTRGRGRVGVMPRRGVSRDLQIIAG